MLDDYICLLFVLFAIVFSGLGVSVSVLYCLGYLEYYWVM